MSGNMLRKTGSFTLRCNHCAGREGYDPIFRTVPESGYLEAPHRKLIFPYYTHFWWHLWQFKVDFVGLVRKKIKFITYMFYLGLPYYYWKYHFWRNLTKFGEIHMRFPNFKYIVIVQIRHELGKGFGKNYFTSKI